MNGFTKLGLPFCKDNQSQGAIRCHGYCIHQSRRHQESYSLEVNKPDNLLTESNCPAISVIHIPRLDSWKADYLSRHCLNQGEWTLHLDIFNQMCQNLGIPDVGILASGFSNKRDPFVARSKDPSVGFGCLVNSLVSVQTNPCLALSANSTSSTQKDRTREDIRMPIAPN